MEDLGRALRLSGNYVFAEELFRKAWSGLRQTLGDYNPHTLEALSCLVELLVNKVRQYLSYSTPWVFLNPYPGCSLSHLSCSLTHLACYITPLVLSSSRALSHSYFAISLISYSLTHIVLPHAFPEGRFITHLPVYSNLCRVTLMVRNR